MVDVVEHQNKRFVRLEVADIERDAMARVQKVRDVVAWQVAEGEQHEIVTYADGFVETVNVARAGDFVVYNVGNGEGETLEQQMATCDQKVIVAENFAALYGLKDDAEETDGRGTVYEYIGEPVFIARVMFPFSLLAPWGQSQYVEGGGYIVYNPNTKEWYGTAGAHDRRAGQLEKTYTIVDDDPRTISKAFRMVIAADRSPLPGVQFNGPDIKRAYEDAGRDLTKMAKYF